MHDGDHSWIAPRGGSLPAILNPAVEIGDDGLVFGAGSRLARTTGGQRRRLDLENDRGRVLALLSVAYRRPIGPEVLAPIEAAALDWQRGEKALANLVFAGLPRLDDPMDAARLRLAEYCLDEGLPPSELLKELGLHPAPSGLAKYNRDEARDAWGRWTDGSSVVTDSTARPDDHRIVVAINERIPDSQKPFKEPVAGEEPEANDEGAHAIPINPFETTVPGPGSGAGPAAAPTASGRAAVSSAFVQGRTGTGGTTLGRLSTIATQAAKTVPPGNGAVYGTAVHSAFRRQIQSLCDPNLTAEQSYLNGVHVDYGTPGAVRCDVVEGPVANPTTVYDLKTGQARLTQSRISEMRSHLPGKGKNVPFIEVRP